MIRLSQIPTARALRAAPAALAGGAWFTRGQGCGYLTALAARPLSLTISFGLGFGLGFGLCAVSGAAGAEPAAIAVPSGQPVTLAEVLLDDAPGETWARFRFVAPQIARRGGSVSHEQAAPDMDHLCAGLALPYLAEQGLAPARVVISLSDRLLPFGTQDAEATQFFEAYRPEGATCIWEAF